jgi:predicted secreted protein
MRFVVAPLLLSLTLAAGMEQAKPDFSGTWTKIRTSPGEAVETMTITQTAATLTVDDGVSRWVEKLDGSESKNITKQGEVRISTTTWAGDALVRRTPIRDTPAPFVLTTVTRLEGATLVIQATSTSEATGAVLNQATRRYSKSAITR